MNYEVFFALLVRMTTTIEVYSTRVDLMGISQDPKIIYRVFHIKYIRVAIGRYMSKRPPSLQEYFKTLYSEKFKSIQKTCSVFRRQRILLILMCICSECRVG